MISCENAFGEEEEISRTQSSETGLDLKEEQTVIGCPGNTSFLDVSQRNIQEFPTYLYEKCSCVKYLYIEGNLLQELSDCFFPSLPSLQWLDVRNNLLRNLPKSVANHCNLEVLLLQRNQIQALPLELGLVPKLRGIQLLGNPIKYPPREVLEQGVQSIIAFLQEEHNIQAPSPSTFRPITEPFYKGSEFTDGLFSQKFRSMSGTVSQRRKSSAPHKRRAASSSLPAITVKSYQKLELQSGLPQRRTSVPISQYKLWNIQQPELILDESKDLPNLTDGIQSVDVKVLQLELQDVTVDTERNRSEVKIHMNLLKEMFMMKVKAMLAKQAATIQKTKDQETLLKWRQNGARVNRKLESGELHSIYTTMLSGVEPLEPTVASQGQNNKTQTKALKNADEEKMEIFKSLQDLKYSRKYTDLSPQSKKSIINNEIQMLEQLQKKLQVLHFQNAHQAMGVPCLPVRGKHIHIEERKNSPQF